MASFLVKVAGRGVLKREKMIYIVNYLQKDLLKNIDQKGKAQKCEEITEYLSVFHNLIAWTKHIILNAIRMSIC